MCSSVLADNARSACVTSMATQPVFHKQLSHSEKVRSLLVRFTDRLGVDACSEEPWRPDTQTGFDRISAAVMDSKHASLCRSA